MYTFLLGLAVLLAGGYLYGKFCERVFGPDHRKTPAYAMADGVNYVPMKKWKNSLIELLNIAGTGPVLGPIQGILFGPIAFVLIPIGCVLGGAAHDYFSGMMSLRHGGEQMPGLMKRFMGRGVYQIYNVFVCLLMFLVGVVFIYTPGDMLAGSILGFSTSFVDANTGSMASWESLIPLLAIYLIILLYYLVATVFPIDTIIGRIYPIFGAILLLSAVGIFVGLFVGGGITTLSEVWGPWPEWVNEGVIGTVFGCGWANLIPMFFITVACGIVSGFHSTQACIIARSVNSEFEGRDTFYMMMILEGFIAMIWAAAAMVVYTNGAAEAGVTGATAVVGIVSRSFLGPVGGVVAILGVVVLAITSGDTALRSLRLMLTDYFHIDQVKTAKRVGLSLVIFIPVAVVLIYSKMDPNGFNVLWRYFSFANETCAVFAFALISVYLYGKHKPWLMTLIPGVFYMFVCSSYLLNAKIGFNLDWLPAYVVAGALTVAYAALVLRAGARRRARLDSGELDPKQFDTPGAWDGVEQDAPQSGKR